MDEVGPTALEIEYEVDTDVPDHLCVKYSSVRRLITELFNLNLKFIDQFFDTYPLFITPINLLETLIRIYKNEENVVSPDPKYLPEKVKLSKIESPVDKATGSYFSVSVVDRDAKNSDHSISIFSKDDKDSTSKADIKTIVDKVVGNEEKKHLGECFSLQDTTNMPKNEAIINPIHRNMSNHRMSIFSRIESGNMPISPSPLSLDSVSSTLEVSSELKVLKILSLWVTKWYIDFDTDNKLHELIVKFIDEIIQAESIDSKKSNLLTRATMLKNKLSDFGGTFGISRQLSKESIIDKSLPTLNTDEVRQKDLPFRKYDPNFIAIGLTQIARKLQKKLNIRQYLNLAWQKDNKHEIAQSVLDISDFSNKLTQLIKTHILTNQNLSKRAKTLEFWLAVVQESLTLKNCNVVANIMAAIESNQIFRLKNTRSKISKNAKRDYDILHKMMDGTSNYGPFRKLYEDKEENYIPFQIPLLHRLIRIEEQKKLKDLLPDGRVNFQKMRAISKPIAIARKSINYQFKNPNYPEAYKVVNKFLEGEVQDDDSLLRMSKNVEPDQML